MSSELELLGLLIKRVQHTHHRELDARLSVLGVSLVQWNALREIARRPGSSQHALAQRTFNTDQAFGTLLTRLASRGLVERHDQSGRSAFHRLTRKGSDLLQLGQSVMEAVLAESFAGLEVTERQELTRLLAQVLKTRGEEVGV